jgi:hypothetical protein
MSQLTGLQALGAAVSREGKRQTGKTGKTGVGRHPRDQQGISPNPRLSKRRDTTQSPDSRTAAASVEEVQGKKEESRRRAQQIVAAALGTDTQTGTG